MDSNTILFIAITFIAYVLRAVLGFGGALIAMPTVSILLGLATTSPLVALMQSTMTALLFFKDRKNIEFGPIWRLVVASFVGIPLGVYFLQAVPEAAMRLLLGLFLIVVGGLNLFNIEVRFPETDAMTYAVGFVNGILAGAYNLIGPLIVMYCASRNWSPTKFRGMLQGYFICINGFVLFNHYWQGMWTPTVFRYYWIGLPIVVVAFFLGNMIHYRLNPELFKRLINIFLVIMGGFMIYQTLV